MPRGPLDRSRAHSLNLERDPLCQIASRQGLPQLPFSHFPQALAVEASSLSPPCGPLPLPYGQPSSSPPRVFSRLLLLLRATAPLWGAGVTTVSPQLQSPLLPVRGASFTGLNGRELGNSRWAGAGPSLSPSGQCPLRLISRRSSRPAPSESGPGCSAPGASPCRCCRSRSGSAACKAHMPCLNLGRLAASCSAIAQPRALCPCSEQSGSRRRPIPPASKDPPPCGHHFGSDPRVSLQRPGIVAGDTWQGLSALPSKTAEAAGKRPLPTEGDALRDFHASPLAGRAGKTGQRFRLIRKFLPVLEQSLPPGQKRPLPSP